MPAPNSPAERDRDAVSYALVTGAPIATACPKWLFTRSGGTWTWRSANDSASKPFPNLDAATADAVTHGFNPLLDYWTATSNGRTTHYRPGKAPINLPYGHEPRR